MIILFGTKAVVHSCGSQWKLIFTLFLLLQKIPCKRQHAYVRVLAWRLGPGDRLWVVQILVHSGSFADLLRSRCNSHKLAMCLVIWSLLRWPKLAAPSYTSADVLARASTHAENKIAQEAGFFMVLESALTSACMLCLCEKLIEMSY